eukprot:403366048
MNQTQSAFQPDQNHTQMEIDSNPPMSFTANPDKPSNPKSSVLSQGKSKVSSTGKEDSAKFDLLKSIKLEVDAELGYDSDLIMDNEDQKKLDEKTDFERERILQDRFEQRQKLKERYELLKREKLEALTGVKQLHSKSSANHKIGKRLQRLSQQQEKHESDHPSQESSKQSKKSQRSSNSLKNRKSRSSRSHSSSSSNSSSSGSSSSSSSGRSSSVESDMPQIKKPQPLNSQTLSSKTYQLQNKNSKLQSDAATLVDAIPIILTRKQLISMLDEDYFDEIIVGCLCKVTYQNSYRVCKIKKAQNALSEYVVENPVRQVGQNKIALPAIYTKKELILKWGSLEKKMKISLVSNQAVSIDELLAFQQMRVKSGQKLITKAFCEAKTRQMNILKNTQKSQESVMKRIRERVRYKIMKGDISGMNLLVEKQKLRTEIQILESEIAEQKKKSVKAKAYTMELQLKDTKEILQKFEKLEQQQIEKQMREMDEDLNMQDESDQHADIEITEGMKAMRDQVLYYRRLDQEKEELHKNLSKLSYAKKINHLIAIQENYFENHSYFPFEERLKTEGFGGLLDMPILENDQGQIDLCSNTFGFGLYCENWKNVNNQISNQFQPDQIKLEEPIPIKQEQPNGMNLRFITFDEYFK